jgi:hypothetical protein
MIRAKVCGPWMVVSLGLGGAMVWARDDKQDKARKMKLMENNFRIISKTKIRIYKGMPLPSHYTFTAFPRL